MISVVIPALDAERELGPTLAALVPAATDGIVREVIVADGGSRDRTILIADDAGAIIVKSGRGRGPQLIAGAAAARGKWLLFLHADTVLEQGWERETGAFMGRVDRGERAETAAAFRFALDDNGAAPRALERMVAMRSRLLKLPFGDQGLLIPRKLYDAIGGYRAVPIMEDVDIVRRLGRRRIAMLASRATTSAGRYKRDGYLRRVLRNQSCLAMYLAGASPERILRRYDGGTE
jgi:rSAM/selenodomain-associated transferase 2